MPCAGRTPYDSTYPASCFLPSLGASSATTARARRLGGSRMRLQDPAAAGVPVAGSSGGGEAQQTLLTAAWGSLGQSGSGGGLAALVQALRSALSAGLALGKDVADKLAQSLDDGLQNAEQTLVSQGMNARQAAHRVASDSRTQPDRRPSATTAPDRRSTRRTRGCRGRRDLRSRAARSIPATA